MASGVEESGDRARNLRPAVPAATWVLRPHVALYARDREARGLAPATIALKPVVLTGFP